MVRNDLREVTHPLLPRSDTLGLKTWPGDPRIVGDVAFRNPDVDRDKISDIFRRALSD